MLKLTLGIASFLLLMTGVYFNHPCFLLFVFPMGLRKDDWAEKTWGYETEGEGDDYYRGGKGT